MAKSRNLIVGCDGTWNDTESDHTNVYKLLDACSPGQKFNQLTHYEEGVGTAFMEELPGGIYGKGLDRQILGAYRWLKKRFADNDCERENNKVFILGFSRGAYAARRLAGLINFCGIPAKLRNVEVAWQIYLKQDADSAKRLKEQGRLFDFPIEMVGVWDTVKSTTEEGFNDHKLPSCVVKGYHAMAIDEKRKFFPVLKWDEEDRVQQLWFSGVHSDVGGGYPETGLSDITLQWMIDRAYKHGLVFKKSAVEKLKIYPCDKLHDSYEGKWKALGTNIRQVGESEMVHVSTKERIEKLADYKPTNLPEAPNYKT